MWWRETLISDLWVGRADPLCRGASDDSVGARRVDHFGAALLHVPLGGLALLVALAVALKRKKKKINSDQNPRRFTFSPAMTCVACVGICWVVKSRFP